MIKWLFGWKEVFILAICEHCEQDMSKADSCIKVPVGTENKTYDPIK